MLAFFSGLREWVNSIPPCNEIDCFPDALEDVLEGVLTAIEAFFAGLFGAT